LAPRRSKGPPVLVPEAEYRAWSGKGHRVNPQRVQQVRFEFTEHVFSADLLSAWYRGTRLGFGTTYYRSYDDVDVERFVVRFSGDYEFVPGYTAQLTYSAYNYDNLSFVGPTYTEYYTGNIVHLSLAYRL